MIEMHIYGIVPDEGPKVYDIAPSLIAEILDGCIPQNSTEFRDVYAAWMDRHAFSYPVPVNAARGAGGRPRPKHGARTLEPLLGPRQPELGDAAGSHR